MIRHEKSYRELIKIPSFEERFDYLKFSGKAFEPTFGSHRFLNQAVYASDRWHKVRRRVIIRDDGCDLGVEGMYISDRIYIHHINPITIDDILNERSCVFDPNNLICVSFNTHNAIHFGSVIKKPYADRSPNDTCPWVVYDEGAVI